MPPPLQGIDVLQQAVPKHNVRNARALPMLVANVIQICIGNKKRPLNSLLLRTIRRYILNSQSGVLSNKEKLRCKSSNIIYTGKTKKQEALPDTIVQWEFTSFSLKELLWWVTPIVTEHNKQMVVRDWATPIFTEHNNHFLERRAVISRSTLRTANVMLLFLMAKKSKKHCPTQLSSGNLQVSCLTSYGFARGRHISKESSLYRSYCKQHTPSGDFMG